MEGNIIMDRDLKRSIILDNYQNANMKHTSDDSFIKINTRNVSCIDNLDIYLKIEDNIIVDASFEGEIHTDTVTVDNAESMSDIGDNTLNTNVVFNTLHKKSAFGIPQKIYIAGIMLLISACLFLYKKKAK